ncbi:MAG: DUF6263 family protein [Sphingobacteriales bacterium]
MKTICSVIFTLIFLAPCQAQKQNLILKLEAGKQFKHTTISTSTIHEVLNGQDFDMVIKLKGTLSYLVKAVNEKDYDLEVKYESLDMTMQLPQGTSEFSSEKNDEQDIPSSMLAAIKNKPFQIKMTQQGKVTEVKNIESVWEAAFSKFSQIPEEQLAPLKAQIIKAYGADAVKGSIEMLTAFFPGKPVSKGDSWTVNTKLEAAMSADLTTVYKFAEENKDYKLITGSSKIETTDKDAYIETNGMPMKYNLTGTMLSEIKVDKSTGWIIEGKVTQEIKGDAIIKENPKMPDGMKIPMTIKNEITISNN